MYVSLFDLILYLSLIHLLHKVLIAQLHLVCLEHLCCNDCFNGIGAVFGLPLSLPFSYFFGAIEIMVPTMMTGMFSGMVVGMSAAMGPVSFSATFMIGAVVGLVTINGIWLANQKLRGPQRLPDAGQPNE